MPLTVTKKTENMMRNVGNSLGTAIQQFGNATSAAAANANGVSFASQNAQGNFNAGQASLANQIGADRIADQYAFNSSQAQMANDFTAAMWEKTAAWNEMMWQKQADFNAKQAQIQRDWQEKMANTSYQRAVTDMKAAGINPILAANGVSNNLPSGSAASVGGTSMSSASGQMASGSIMNGVSASEGNFTGQMDYMGGMLGLLSAAIGGISTALQSFGGMGQLGNIIVNELDPSKWFEFNPWWKEKDTSRSSSSGKTHTGNSGHFNENYKHILGPKN